MRLVRRSDVAVRSGALSEGKGATVNFWRSSSTTSSRRHTWQRYTRPDCGAISPSACRIWISHAGHRHGIDATSPRVINANANSTRDLRVPQMSEIATAIADTAAMVRRPAVSAPRSDGAARDRGKLGYCDFDGRFDDARTDGDRGRH